MQYGQKGFVSIYLQYEFGGRMGSRRALSVKFFFALGIFRHFYACAWAEFSVSLKGRVSRGHKKGLASLRTAG